MTIQSKVHAIRFNKEESDIIEKYREGRLISFSGAVKELIFVGDDALNNSIQSAGLNDYLKISHKIQIESIFILRSLLNSVDPNLLEEARNEALACYNALDLTKKL